MPTRLNLAILLLCLSAPCFAINKCVDSAGKFSYTDAKCPAGTRLVDTLQEATPPSPEDVQKSQDAKARLQDELEQAQTQRAAQEEKRLRAEREAAAERREQERLELERRKVEALEAQARAAQAPTIYVAPVPRPLRPQPDAHYHPNKPKKTNDPLLSDRLRPPASAQSTPNTTR